MLGPTELELHALLGMPPRISAAHLQAVAALIDRQSTLKIIESVLSDPGALQQIAARSYTHTLGFKKIVLLDPGLDLPDGSRGFGYQLRLHLWEPGTTGSAPLVESMHEHSFDFISHLLEGQMENQCYNIEPSSAGNELLLSRMLLQLRELSASERMELNRQMEAGEAVRLQPYESLQAAAEGLDARFDRRWLLEKLGLAPEELLTAIGMHGRYQSVMSGTQAGTYVHRLVENINLKPYAVLRLRAGDTYHHPHRFAHRLYIPANQSNATMIVTTPVSQSAMGGSFQRPSWIDGSDVSYSRTVYTTEELAATLRAFHARLKSQAQTGSGRLLDVACASG